jgi:hypothetical protein
MLHRMLSILKNKVTRQVGAGLALAAIFVGCTNTSEPAPEPNTDYYPVAVGNFWVYAVTDTTWSQAPPVPSIPTPGNYQFRETITEVFTDAAGKPAYRMVRARRANSTAVWRDDSVFVLSTTPNYVAFNRNNARTIELIFPVKEGRSWNFNGFNNNTNDTISAETRQYSRVGQPYVVGGGSSGIPAVTYPATLTTNNTGTAALNSLLRRTSYQQVFAKGVGPVFRRRANFAFYTYTDPNPPYNQIFPPNSYSSGFTRRETLIDYGPR